MAKELKIITAAKAARADGYTHLTSIVKSVFRTEYYNVNSIEEVLTEGKWIAAPNHNGAWCGPVGVTYNSLPAKCINKSVAIEKYCDK